MKEQIFEMRDVTVVLGFKPVLRNFSLSLSVGESLGLLGPNGSGKTTCLRAILGMIGKKSGELSLFGKKPGDHKSLLKIGYAPEDGAAPEYLTAKEYLSFVAASKLSKESDPEVSVTELLDYFELPAKGYVKGFSKGMRRRVILAQALMGNPSFLVLDEPLNGLDPIFIIKLRERLAKYLKGGGSLIYSSHILSEIEKSCDRIAILREGTVASDLTTQELLAKYQSVEVAYREILGGGQDAFSS